QLRLQHARRADVHGVGARAALAMGQTAGATIVAIRGTSMTTRPSCIVSARDLAERTHVYPQSTERMGPVRRLGKSAGLVRIGVNLQRLPPGTRSSWPHAEENEEEFVYVLEGEVDAWINGDLHRMGPRDLAAFPAGTGI